MAYLSRPPSLVCSLEKTSLVAMEYLKDSHNGASFSSRRKTECSLPTAMAQLTRVFLKPDDAPSITLPYSFS